MNLKVCLECPLHIFKDLVNAMLSGTERQKRRRRVHSEEAINSLRLKNSRSWYLLRVTALCRATKVLLNDAKTVDEVSEKLLEINKAFVRFERATTTTSLP